MIKLFIKFRIFIKYLFNPSYRRFIKMFRDEVHYTFLRESFPRVDCSYKDYLFNNTTFGDVNE